MAPAQNKNCIKLTIITLMVGQISVIYGKNQTSCKTQRQNQAKLSVFQADLHAMETFPRGNESEYFTSHLTKLYNILINIL